MTEISDIFDQLRAAAASRDGDAVEMWIGQLELSHEEPHWPDELFQGVKGLLLDDEFLSVGTSWHLSNVVARCWDELTDHQREDLAAVWPIVFDRFADWMGAFVVAEILGERYANDAAYRTLDQLSRTARIPHRALAAYGLGKLARTVKSGPLFDNERLQELAVDKVADVRKEASGALHVLEKTT